MAFTQDELDYIRTQPVGRIGTAAADGQPDAVPVGIEYDGTYFYVGGGHEPEKTRKFLNVAAGNDKVVLIWETSLRPPRGRHGSSACTGLASSSPTRGCSGRARTCGSRRRCRGAGTSKRSRSTGLMIGSSSRGVRSTATRPCRRAERLVRSLAAPRAGRPGADGVRRRRVDRPRVHV